MFQSAASQKALRTRLWDLNALARAMQMRGRGPPSKLIVLHMLRRSLHLFIGQMYKKTWNISVEAHPESPYIDDVDGVSMPGKGLTGTLPGPGAFTPSWAATSNYGRKAQSARRKAKNRQEISRSSKQYIKNINISITKISRRAVI